jgi:hypothetical protein
VSIETRGAQGDPGKRGAQGDPGKRGAQGDPGTPADLATMKRNTLRIRVLFAGLLLLFGLLSFRTEYQQRGVERNTENIAQNARATCLGGLMILKQFNATQRALADIERTIQPNSRLGRARIKVLEASVLPVDPNACDAKPPPPTPEGVATNGQG